MNKIKQKNGFVQEELFRKLALASSVFVFVLGVAFVAPFYVDKSEAVVGDSTESNLTLTTSNAAASVNLESVAANGSFATSDIDANFSITTTNYTGYTLVISSSTRALVGEIDGENYSLAPIPAPLNAEVFDTPAYNNMWGYLPSKFNSQDNIDMLYRPAPIGSDVLDITNTANSVANIYTIGMAIRADYNSPAGTYTNTFVVSAVANPVNYEVFYADISGDETVTGLPSAQSGNTSATTIILSEATPVRIGYTFEHWCLGEISAENGTCIGSAYAPGSVFGIDQTVLNSVTLYAVWTQNGEPVAPVAPATPEVPAEPEAPEEPATPEAPEEEPPVAPEEPEVPAEPEVPEEPATPEASEATEAEPEA